MLTPTGYWIALALVAAVCATAACVAFLVDVGIVIGAYASGF